MKGLFTSEGFVGNVKDISPDDANILKILYQAGAVLYIRTTEPQGLVSLQ